MRYMQLTRLCVKNFGPIKEADIELGDLTVITGAQNSGKSYLATLIYALSNDLTRKLYSLLPEAIREFKIYDVKILERSIYDVNILRREVEGKRDVINKYLDDNLSRHIGIKSILNRHFLMDMGEIIRARSYSMKIIAEYTIAKDTNDVRYMVEIRKGKRKGKREEKGESLELEEYHALEEYHTLEGKDKLIDKCIDEWAKNPQEWVDNLLEWAKSLLTSSSYTFPTPRTPFVLFIPVERMLILSLFSLTTSLILEYLYRYSEIFAIKACISSYLQVLHSILANPSSYEILDIGSLSIKGKGELPMSTISFHDRERNVALPLYTTGSGIIQLAGIILPLSSHHISSGLVIIEEPEVNLHADMHLKVADYIADKIAEGRKMVITTHSEYLLARLAQLYAEGKINDMKVYYIDRQDRVRRLDIDKERGEIELPEGIRDAIYTLSKDALRLIEVE